ncbi:MAG: hypothetical protein ACM3U1_08690 [Chloroflexota bacterium]
MKGKTGTAAERKKNAMAAEDFRYIISMIKNAEQNVETKLFWLGRYEEEFARGKMSIEQFDKIYKRIDLDQETLDKINWPGNNRPNMLDVIRERKIPENEQDSSYSDKHAYALSRADFHKLIDEIIEIELNMETRIYLYGKLGEVCVYRGMSWDQYRIYNKILNIDQETRDKIDW